MEVKKLYFSNLDASRFFAFILVFMAHCFVSTDTGIRESSLFISVYQWGKMGVLGLEYFFVLSSFLISTIILEEKKQTSDLNISNFLIRRTLRVWPLYFLILGIGYLVVFLAYINNISISPLPPWPFMFFFLINFYIIQNGAEFLFFISFLWSISVEEQFYLIWAIFMKFLQGNFVLFCLLLILISILFRFYYFENSATLYFHTVSAFGNFGIGGLLAWGIYNKNSFVIKISEGPSSVNLIFYLLLVLLLIFYHGLMKYDLFRLSERLIYSLFFAYFILDQTIGKNRLFNCGKWPFINYLGKISYGLYCFHGVVITLFIYLLPHVYPNQSMWVVFLIFPVIIFVATVLLSHLSYRYFEVYFLRLKNKYYSFQP